MENTPPPASTAAEPGSFNFSSLSLSAKYDIAARLMANGLSDAQVLEQLLTLEVELLEGTSETERKIVLEESHFNRGDVSDYVIRSTMSTRL